MSVDGLELDRLIRKSPTSLAAYISELQANQNSGPEESLFGGSGSSSDLQQAMAAAAPVTSSAQQPPIAKVSPQPYVPEQQQQQQEQLIYQQPQMTRTFLQTQRYHLPQQHQQQSFSAVGQQLQEQQQRADCEDLLVTSAPLAGQPQLQQFGHLAARDESDLFANLQYQVSSGRRMRPGWVSISQKGS